MIQKDVLVDGVRWCVREEGLGPPLVLVHGFFSSSYTWLKVFPYFSSRFRVIAPDLPGFGYSDRPQGFDHTAAGEAKALARFLEAYGISKAVVMGHSMGGAIAMLLAAQHPLWVERLILVTSATPWTKPIPSYQMLRVPILGELMMLFLSRPAIEQSLRRRLFADAAKVTEDVVSGWYEPMTAPGSRRAALNMIRTKASGYEDLPRRLACQTFVVNCREDRLISWREGEMLAKALPKGEFAVLDGVGHLPQEEAPDLFANTVLPFLNR